MLDEVRARIAAARLRSAGQFGQRAVPCRRPRPARHDRLPSFLVDKLKTLHGRVGYLLHPTFEHWELMFHCSTNPVRGIAIWEVMADAFEAYMERHPEADRGRVLRMVAAVSINAKVPRLTDEIEEAGELYADAWKRLVGE